MTHFTFDTITLHPSRETYFKSILVSPELVPVADVYLYLMLLILVQSISWKQVSIQYADSEWRVLLGRSPLLELICFQGFWDLKTRTNGSISNTLSQIRTSSAKKGKLNHYFKDECQILPWFSRFLSPLSAHRKLCWYPANPSKKSLLVEMNSYSSPLRPCCPFRWHYQSSLI